MAGNHRSDTTEAEYLASYSRAEFDSPLLTLDAALFTFHQEQLQLLLVQRANHPAKGVWGLPGGFVDTAADADLEACIRRVLVAKTGVVPPYIEQLGSYGGSRRDPRGWSATVCYTALIAHQNCAAQVDSVADAQWVPLQELRALPALAFDHGQMVEDARERLRQKALYSIVPAYALPEEFTLPQLQQLHEALIGKPLQKKSFRRRIEQANLLEDTGSKRSEGGRPATLYRLRAGGGEHFFVRNLES